MSTEFDLIVVGSGPAGYVGAIYAAQHGMKVALVEKAPTLGGTCLNIGCIPTKAMLFSAMQFDKAKNLSKYGIKFKGGIPELELDFEQVNKRKNDIVKQITNGVAFLVKKNKIELFKGFGKLLDNRSVEVMLTDTEKVVLSGKNILLATGSVVKTFPNMPIDQIDVISSDEILFLDKVPSSLGIIGGGVIGCEFASCYGRFGSQVTIFELTEQILPTEDVEIATELSKNLRKQNCEIRTQTKVLGVKAENGKAYVMVEGEAQPFEFDKVLVSVGRAPCTKNIGLEKAGVEVQTNGFIPVDLNTYQTNCPNIYAVGDIIPTPQLAHTASAEAIFAVDAMLGKKREKINYLSNPSATYTYPEVASVGLTEKNAKAAGMNVKIGKFPFMAIGKAKIEDSTDGFTKIVINADTNKVVGVHILHAKATELIAEAVLGLNLEMTIEQLSHTIHPHPTISEAVMEAAHAGTGHAIHI